MPTAIILVTLLTISGMSFMHLDLLERRMVMNEVDNHGAFYLANAGLERARQIYRPTTDLNWTSVLDGSDPDYPAEQATDPFFDPRLCPDIARGCAIPTFQVAGANPDVIATTGEPVTGASGADPLLLAALWPKVPGETIAYSVRAFNNGGPADVGTTDGDSQITIRALGTVRGEEKLLEATVVAVSGLGWANCQGDPGDPSPDDVNPNAELDYLSGREARTFSTLPIIDFGFYREPANFPWTTSLQECGAGIDCTTNPIVINVENDTFYRIEGVAPSNGVLVDSHDKQNIAVYSEPSVQVQGHDALDNVVIVSQGNVQLQGNVTVTAPLGPPTAPVMYPAVVAGGNVGADRSVLVVGNIYAAGVIDFRPIEIHGMLVGTDIPNSTSKCNTRGFEDLRRGFEAEAFPRPVIEPAFDRLYSAL